MHFLRPEVFYLLIPFFISMFALFWKQKKAGAWNLVIAKHLMPYLLQGKTESRLSPGLLTVLFGTLLITALAGPTWKKSAVPIVQGKSGLVIALDLSVSMDASDLKPSRLQRAIYKINDILDKRKEGQTALIVYTDEAFVVTPLTDDTKTIKALLPALETSIMPAYGLRHDRAITKSTELLKQAGITSGSILLITGEFPAQIPSIVSDIPISVLGVGTEEGAPIPKKGGGFVLDEKGGVTITKLNKEKLSGLAASTGGRYSTIRFDDRDIQELLGGVKQKAQSDQEEGLTHMKWHDQGYWLVLLTLPFAAYLLRRGSLAFILILFVFPVQGFWKTPNQKGVEYFEQENYDKAAKAFVDAKWQAASQYKSKNYEEAETLYQNDKTADGYYNLGNALAQQGKYEEAISAYEKAIELDPNHEDAFHNKKVVEDLQQQQNQQDKGENQGDQNKDQNDQKGEQDNQDKNGDQNDQKVEQDNQDQDQDEQDQNSKEEQENQDQDENRDEEKEQQQYRDQVDEELENQDPQEMAASDESEMDPQRQIDDRWLQKIPDDPGGLLRRKFLYQYRKQKGR